MKDTLDKSNKFEQLRLQAEDLIRQRPDFTAETPTDILQLIHELKIYQAELEIQNEELKRAQQEISDLNREYENLYEFAPCGYATLNAKGIITRVNLTGAALLGETRSRLAFTGFHKFIASGWGNTFLTARQMAGETGEKQSIEVPLNRENGSTRWVRLDIEADREDTGAVIQWRMVLMDITQKKEAEAMLLESEERFRDLFENAPVAYQALDREGNFIEINKTWQSTLGYNKHEVIGTNFSKFLHSDLQDRFKKNFVHFTTIGEILGPEFVMWKKDGSDILVSFQGKVSRNAKDEVKQIHCILYDITAQRQAEKDRKRLEEQLRQVQKMEAIGTLAGGVAHDFNNLLMAIQGRASLLSIDLDPQHPGQEQFAGIKECIRSAANLTQQLLGFARGGKYQVKPLDVDALVTAVADMFGRTRKEIQIYIRSQAVSKVVEADKNQIEQVLLNILVNAWQAMPNGGELYLATSIAHLNETVCDPHQIEPGSYVQISITDTGPGMDEKIRKRVFDPFFTTKEKGRGTGLGMASAYGIIKNHGGIITVYSGVGKGSTFKIYLPISDKEPYREIDIRESLIKGSDTILLVDDEAIVADAGAAMLKKLGYRVMVARSGQQALETVILKGGAIDLVILDLIMPGMDGGTAFDRIRELHPAIPVLLCSGYGMNEQVIRIMQRGCNGFIQKPFDLPKLSQKIRNILDQVKPAGQP